MVLIDTSIWIEYFKTGSNSKTMDWLIDEALVVTNALIMAELIPVLTIRKQNRIIELLRAIEQIPLNIEWSQIIEMQICCLKNGINKVGIPDLIIAQQAIQTSTPLFSTDKHFKLISAHYGIPLYET